MLPRQPQEPVMLGPNLYGMPQPLVDGKVKESTPIRQPEEQVWEWRRFDLGLVLTCLFLPFLDFVIISFVYCTCFRSMQMGWVLVILFLVALTVPISGWKAWSTWRMVKLHREKLNTEGAKAGWWLLIFVLCLFAVFFGVVTGDLNYWYNLEAYCRDGTGRLQNYLDIDPSHTKGTEVQDSGRVSFAPGSYLDLKKSMSFKNQDWYCVAPIVKGDQSTGVLNDFWAVGLNCCSDIPGDYTCGEFNNYNARSGLRLTREDERQFYQLAVQQAEAKFKLQSDHPVFFAWVQDPVALLNKYLDDARGYFWIGVATAFAFDLFFVVAGVLLLGRAPVYKYAHPFGL